MLILEANDTIAPVQPKPGTQVLIPSQMLLPDVPRGHCRQPRRTAAVLLPAGRESGAGLSAGHWPVRSGNAGDDHPRGAEILTLRTPTAGIRARSLEKGVTLPAVVPAGPNNPTGRYALRLAYGNGEYLIHGTNAPDSVGLRVSSGCMRMNADDIKALFSR